MTTSLDPGTLGIYGFRNRADHTYDGLKIATSRSITAPAIWDHLAREGKRSIIVGVPPGYPPRRINGIAVSCFLTPDTDKNVFTHPPELSDEIRQLVGHYPVDVQGFRTGDKAWLRDEIFAMSRTQFQVVRHLLSKRAMGLLPLRRYRSGPGASRLLEVPRPATTFFTRATVRLPRRSMTITGTSTPRSAGCSSF